MIMVTFCKLNVRLLKMIINAALDLFHTQHTELWICYFKTGFSQAQNVLLSVQFSLNLHTSISDEG